MLDSEIIQYFGQNSNHRLSSVILLHVYSLPKRCRNKGMGSIYPPIIGPHPSNNYKIHTPNMFTLPNLLNVDHLVLRT